MNEKWLLAVMALVLPLAGSAHAQVISFEKWGDGVRVKENAGTAVVGVVREGPTNAVSKVRWNLEKEDPGIFAPYTGQIVFAPGERRQEFTLIVLDYPYADFAHGGTILLDNVQGATLLPDGKRIRVDVLDNEFPRDLGKPPMEFYPRQPSAPAGEASAQLSLHRLGDSDQSLTVNFSTADQTAKAGIHYVAQSLSVTLAPLETEKIITIPLLNGPIAGRDVSLELILRGVEAGKGWTNRSILKLVDNIRPGAVDLSFDAGEIERTTFNELPMIQGTVLSPDGRVYISGIISYVQGVARPGLARLLPNGRLDSTFLEHSGPPRLFERVWGDLFLQPNGHFITSYGSRFFPDGTRETQAMPLNLFICGVLPQGKLIAQAFDFPPGMIYRLNSDGSVDESFKPGATNFDSSLFIDPDGRILVPQWPPDGNIYRLVRLLPDGALDTSFQCTATSSVRVVARQPDGRYICGGTDKWLLRLNSDGSPDPSFSLPDDLFLQSEPPWLPSDYIYDIAIQPDGKILVAGTFAHPRSRSHGGLLRLNSDGSLDTSFDVGEGAGAGGIGSILLQPDGQILLSGGFDSFDGFPRMNLVRLNGYTPLRVRAESVSEGMRLTVTGRSASGYLEYSTDLLSWERFVNSAFCPEPEAFEFVDPSQTRAAPRTRFYRAVFDASSSACAKN